MPLIEMSPNHSIMNTVSVVRVSLSADQTRIVYPTRTTEQQKRKNIKKIEYGTITEYIGKSLRDETPHHYLEYYTADTVVHPIFDKDADGYVNKPDDTECQRVLGESIAMLKELFHQLGGVEDDDIYIATREPRLTKKNGWKISYRFYIPKYSIKPGNLLRLLYALEQDSFWDTSIYSKENLLFMIGSNKYFDTPTLLPVNHTENIFGFIAQGISGDEVGLDEGCEAMWVKFGDPLEHKQHRDTPELDGAEQSVVVQKALEVVRGLGDTHSTHDRGYRFQTHSHHGRPCFISGETHYNNGFYVEPLADGQLLGVCLAKSHGKHNSKILGRWRPQECMLLDDPEPVSIPRPPSPSVPKETPNDETCLNSSFDYIFKHRFYQVKTVHKINMVYLSADKTVKKLKAKLKKLDDDDEDREGIQEKIESFEMKMGEMYDTILRYFDRFFFTLNTTKIEVIETFYDKKGRLVDYIRRSVRETNVMCANALFNGKNAFEFWWLWYDKRTYDRVVCEPTGVVGEREFNIFLGLKVDRDYNWKKYPVDESRISKIIHHIRVVLCDNNEEMFQFLMKGYKTMFVEKKRRLNANVFTGGEGDGKTCICVDFFGKLIVGSDISGTRSRGSFCMLSTVDDLVGRFNGMSVNRLYINLNEPAMASGHVVAGKIKTFTTDEITRLEQKGLDVINMKNISSLDITTNEHDVVKTSPKDRRWVVARTNGVYAGNKQYFKELFEEILAPETPAYFMKWLDETFDTRNYHSLPLPMTDEKIDMITRNTPSPARFLVDLLRGDAEVLKPSALDRPAVLSEWHRISTEDFYNGYCLWFDAQNFAYYESKKASRQDFTKFFVKELGVKNQVIRFEGENKRGFIFPSKNALWSVLLKKEFAFGTMV